MISFRLIKPAHCTYLTWAAECAMQFAVAVSIAESIEKGQNITEVRIDSYDPKKPLVTLGKKLWHQFKTEASNDPNIKLLSEAISKIKFKASTSQNVLRGGNIVSESWISAIHASPRFLIYTK